MFPDAAEYVKLCSHLYIHSQGVFFSRIENKFHYLRKAGIIQGFVQDWVNPLLSESSGGRPAKEYHISLGMAKELSMVACNDKGKQARLYFIGCEKRALAVTAALPSEVI